MRKEFLFWLVLSIGGAAVMASFAVRTLLAWWNGG